MSTVIDAELLEREEELDSLRALLAGARDGRGGIVLVEGPAGQGKTTLLRAARAQAVGEGLRVLSAVGAELERDFAYGIVRQLFLPVVGDVEPTGAAAQALPVIDGPYDSALDPAACHNRLHALFALGAQLAAQRPLAIIVDDAHWADAGSLKALGMLARRVEDLPVALIIGLRPAIAPEGAALLDPLFAVPGAIVMRPGPLSHDAVAHLIGGAIDGDADPAFVTAAAETTGGNPLLVSELRRTLAAEAFTGTAAEARRVRGAVPGSIARLVQGRLWRLGPAAVALARAVAALGDRATLEIANTLAGLDSGVAASAHASLAAVGLLEPGALRFTHPMMREATLAGLVPATRSWFHRRAALLLHEAGAPEEEIAAQVLAAEPGTDPRAARLLLDTGRRALAAGDSEVALHHLRRALRESGAAPDPALLLALGLAEARTGGSGALTWLTRAAQVGSPEIAARAEQASARVLVLAGQARGAAERLDRGLELAGGVDDALAAELEDDLFDGLNYDYDLAAERRARLDAADDRPVVLAHRAFDRAATGAPASEVVDLARRALANGELVGAIERPAAVYAIEALMAVEAADEAHAAIDALAAAARRAGSRVGAGAVAHALAHWEHEFGDLEAGQAAARSAIDLQTSLSGLQASRAVRAALAANLFDAGDVEGAERLLTAETDPTAPEPRETVLPICGFNAVRGRVLLSQGRPEEAIAELEQHLALEAQRGWVATFREPTRPALVAALIDAARYDEARALAQSELALARRRGLHGAEARLLLAGARLELGRDAEIEVLTQALAAARRSPSGRLVAEVAAELGLALRRAGRRADARNPLREARELALRAGAKALEERAHQELLIAGARPQRVAQAGVGGLTPSERRVAELAAAGRRNREIAEQLFVTLKTVEVHLGRAYGKLGINSRTQLAAALA